MAKNGSEKTTWSFDIQILFNMTCVSKYFSIPLQMIWTFINADENLMFAFHVPFNIYCQCWVVTDYM